MGLILLLGLFSFLPLAAQDPGIQLTSVIAGISAPTDIQNAADGTNRLFLVQQNGIVRIWKNGALMPQPFLDIHTRTTGDGERGLLGLAFPPGYASKQRFYVDYTNLAGDTVIAMYRVTSNPDVADFASETKLMTITQPFANHNGGQVRFGPDSYLYIGMGDGGSGGDPQHNGQNPQALLGKILRIDVESQPGHVVIPPGNPFAGSASARPEIWALGMRNPWRFSFDRATGDLWIADVGQDDWEEVDFQPASSHGGENYGWNTMEGNHCYGAATCNTQGLVLPVAEYSHAVGCSITGGFVYRGLSFPALAGAYIYGDYCSGRMWSARRNGNQVTSQQVLASGLSITTFGEDEQGEMYVADARGGVIYRVESNAVAQITIASSPAGQVFTIDQDPAQHTAPETLSLTGGSNHTITWINPQSGATRTMFSAWSDGNTSNPRTITAGGAATYTGNFEIQYALTQNVSAGGTVTISPGSTVYYASGAVLQATAVANAGYRFGGFSGCVTSTAGVVTFTMSAPCTLTAGFVFDGSTLTGLRFVRVIPCRLMDTRDATKSGTYGPPFISDGTHRDVPVPQGACNIPGAAKAYSLNVTVVPKVLLGYLTLWAAGQPQPLVSTMNSDGRVVANAAIVPAGPNTSISVYATDSTDVILDINGYFTDVEDGALAFYPTVPCRNVDTRGESGQTGSLGPPILSAGARRDFSMLQGPCALPQQAQVFSLNATVVPDGPMQYLTLWPAGTPQPPVSTLNSFEGKVVANAAITGGSVSGIVSAYAAGRTQLILDSNGYFATRGGVGALSFNLVNPCRVADTREATGQSVGLGMPAMNARTQRNFAIPQSSCGIPATAKAYSLNITVVPRGVLSFLTLWPAGQPQPIVSTLNSFDGRVVANAALVPAGTNGAVSIYVTDATDVIIDINGYFAP